MSYCENAWNELYPDPRERAKAEAKMEAESDAYDPCAVECDEMSGGDFEVLVIDRSGIVGDIRVYLWLVEGEINTQWADRDFYGALRNRDWWRVLQLGDENIVQKAFNAAESYMVEQGLIYRLPDGTWAEAEPY